MSNTPSVMGPFYPILLAEVERLMDNTEATPDSFDGRCLTLLATVVELHERERLPHMFDSAPVPKPLCELTHLEALDALLTAEGEIARLNGLLDAR
jgi:antitoxin component HigA of HigAB toxin-antitoxin module